MKKLSELPEGIVLVTYKNGGNLEVTTKKDLLENLEYFKSNVKSGMKVSIGDKTVAGFSFESAVEDASQEMYEDWTQDVWYELEKLNIDFKSVEAAIQKVFDEHPAYYEGEEVEIDM